MYINSINNNYNTNFKSRNAEIRFADNIVRKVNQEFPRFSNTIISDFKYIDNFPNLKNRISKGVSKMRDRRFRFFTTSNKEFGLMAIVDPIKEMRYGNCGESAFLSIICAKINRLKNVQIASLYSPGDYNYDHAVVLINKDKKPYILDAWLGFADYLPNAIKRWQNEFKHHFDFDLAGTNKITLKEYTTRQSVFLKELSSNIMRKICPELIMPKKRVKSQKRSGKLKIRVRLNSPS